jgi:hypothetical protein
LSLISYRIELAKVAFLTALNEETLTARAAFFSNWLIHTHQHLGPLDIRIAHFQSSPQVSVPSLCSLLGDNLSDRFAYCALA